MTRRLSRARLVARVVRTLTVGALLGIVWWIARSHASGASGVSQAAVFTWIIEAIVFVANGVEHVVTYTLAGAVSLLAQSLAWLGRRVRSILLSTGSVFARVWDGFRIAWNDVLRPSLQFLDRQIRRIHDWLGRTLQPVFDFFNSVREHLNAIYRRFVRPVLDAIDVVHQVNSLLHLFHIHVLDKLDTTLQTFERAVNERVAWIYGRINLLEGWVNRIVDGNGFFQRYTLLHSLFRDLIYQWRILINPGIRELTPYEEALLGKLAHTTSPPLLSEDLSAYWHGQGSVEGETIDGIVANMRTTWDSFG